MIFDKPTLRTQVSFAAGIAELGGNPMLVDGRLAGIGVRESVEDVARVLGRQVVLGRLADLRAVRPRADGGVLRRAGRQRPDRRVPPLPAPRRPADRREHKGALAGLTVAFVGDAANNMGNSWLLAGATAGMHVRLAGPSGYLPSEAMFERAARIAATTGGSRHGSVRPGGGRRRRRRRRHRHLGVDGQGGRGGRQGGGLRVVLAHRGPARARPGRRGGAALPAGLPRQGDRRPR